jgi:hypothetical protein
VSGFWGSSGVFGFRLWLECLKIVTQATHCTDQLGRLRWLGADKQLKAKQTNLTCNKKIIINKGENDPRKLDLLQALGQLLGASGYQ